VHQQAGLGREKRRPVVSPMGKCSVTIATSSPLPFVDGLHYLVTRRWCPLELIQEINARTPAGRLLERMLLRLADGMARVVDDGSDLHVLPIVMRCHGRQEFATLIARR
jgi:hypothetical protein